MNKYEAPAFELYEINAEDIVATSKTESVPNTGGNATGNWGGDGGYFD